MDGGRSHRLRVPFGYSRIRYHARGWIEQAYDCASDSGQAQCQRSDRGQLLWLGSRQLPGRGQFSSVHIDGAPRGRRRPETPTVRPGGLILQTAGLVATGRLRDRDPLSLSLSQTVRLYDTAEQAVRYQLKAVFLAIPRCRAVLVNLGDQKVHKMVKFCVHQCTQTARRYEGSLATY